MHIEKAKLLKIGDVVRCPADRGEPKFVGSVTHVGNEVYKDLPGVEYIWVTVRGAKHESVWPSNRLGVK